MQSTVCVYVCKSVCARGRVCVCAHVFVCACVVLYRIMPQWGYIHSITHTHTHTKMYIHTWLCSPILSNKITVVYTQTCTHIPNDLQIFLIRKHNVPRRVERQPGSIATSHYTTPSQCYPLCCTISHHAEQHSSNRVFSVCTHTHTSHSHNTRTQQSVFHNQNVSKQKSKPFTCTFFLDKMIDSTSHFHSQKVISPV